MRCHRLLERLFSHVHTARSVRYATLLFLAFGTPICASAQFEMQDSTTTASLRGIASPGNGVAWASGTGGTVLRTEDGGFVWQGCAMPPGAETLDFRGVQAFDGQTALVMSSGKGDLSRVYKTTDGCRTWKLVFTNPDAEGFFDAVSVQFLRRDQLGQPLDGTLSTGLLLGDPVAGVFPLFITGDGGSTWQRRKDSPAKNGFSGCKIAQFKAHGGEASFAASNQALVALGFATPVFVTGGSVARLAYSTEFSLDGALCHLSAHEKSLPMAHAKASAGAFAIAANENVSTGQALEGTFVVVGGDYLAPEQNLGVAATLKDPSGLFSSAAIAQTPPHGYRSSVAYDAPSKTWITVGPNGTDVSRDDGRNWSPLRPGTGDAPDADKQWNALALPFVVGPHGRIGRLRERVLKPAAAGSAR